MEVQYIPISRLVEDNEQPRKQHSEESLQGLADSIRQHGLLNPITVSPLSDGNRYKIVTGERRWRAATMARLESIPCIVKNIDSEERLTEQLVENLQREDLQPLEKAKAIHHVKSSLSLTNREVAKRLGLSERSIGYLLDLLDLPETISEAVVSSPNRPADGQVTEKHARFLKQLNSEPDIQAEVVERIRGQRLSTEDTGSLVKALKKQPDKAREILDSPSDHLSKFFQDTSDPTDALLNDRAVTEAPARLSPHAQQILDFLPRLSGIAPARMSQPELRQVEDALTSLQMAVEGLLRSCKEQLGERV